MMARGGRYPQVPFLRVAEVSPAAAPALDWPGSNTAQRSGRSPLSVRGTDQACEIFLGPEISLSASCRITESRTRPFFLADLFYLFFPRALTLFGATGAVLSAPFTTTVTEADVPMLPAASRATAPSRCVPSLTGCVFQ